MGLSVNCPSTFEDLKIVKKKKSPIYKKELMKYFY